MSTLPAALKPLYTTSKILGIAPFGYNRARYRTSIAGACHSILMSCLIWFCCAYTFWTNPYQRVSNEMQRFINNLQVTTGIVTFAILIVTENVNQARIISIVHELDAIFEKLFRSGTLVKSDYYTRVFISLTRVLIMIMLALIFIFTVDFLNFIRVFEWTATLKMFEYLWPSTISTFAILQFCTYNMLIRRAFTSAHDELRAMTELCMKGKKVTGSDASVFHVRNVTSEALLEQRLLIAVRKTRRLHYKITECSKQLNDAYAFAILVIFGQNFLTMLTLAYYWTEKFYHKSRMKFFYMLYSLAYFTLLATQIVAVVGICQSVTNRAAQVNRVLHKNCAKFAPLRDEILLFSQQVIFQRVNFSAFGFFALNNQFLCSMVASITTYLVILVQFDTLEPKGGTTPGPPTALNVPDVFENA